MRRFATVALGILIPLLTSFTLAQRTPTTSVPTLIRYSGVLKEVQGTSLSGTKQGITFAIYNQQEGGAPVWMEVQNVTVDASGHYSVLLGSTTAAGLPDDLFSPQEQRWLGVQVQGQAEQARVLLVSVPYAMKAAEADRLAGHSASEFVTTDNLQAAVKEQLQLQPAVTTAPSQSATSRRAAADPYIENGTVTQSGANFNIDGSGVATTFWAATFQSTSQTWLGMGGAPVLGINDDPLYNLFMGPGAGSNNHGYYSTFLGMKAGHNSTNAFADTFVGFAAGYFNTGGQNDTFVGAAAGWYNTGSDNTFVGSWTGFRNTTGHDNTFDGFEAGVYNTTGSFNTFTGNLAGYANTTGFENTFAGNAAGYHNTTGSGNTFAGHNAGWFNTTGYANTFTGNSAGFHNTIGIANTFTGYTTGVHNTTGSFNTFTGNLAGYANTIGSSNTFAGYAAGYANTTGIRNTFLGENAGKPLSTGSNNVFLGFDAGLSAGSAASNDVYIANQGVATDNGVIRVGEPASQTAAYIAGIYDSTVGSGVPVYINSDGLLGTLTSSLRFKEQVRDMGGSSSALMKLRPVTFLYKPEYDKGPRTLQYGLIAEEVAEVYPDLVAYEPDGKPYTVKYQYLASMLLNELQKQHAVVAVQQERIKSLQEELQQQREEFQERLSRLEKLISQAPTVTQK